MSYALGGVDETITFQNMAAQIMQKVLDQNIVGGFNMGELIPNSIEPMAVNMIANMLARKLGDEMNIQSQNTDSMGYAIAREIGEQLASNGMVFNYDQDSDMVVGGMWWSGIIGSESSPGALSVVISNAIEDVLEHIGFETTPVDTDEPDAWDTGFTPIYIPGMTVGPGDMYEVADVGGKITGFKTTPTKYGVGLPIPILVGAGAAALILLKKKKK